MAKNDRFEKVYSQGQINVTEIWVDKEENKKLNIKIIIYGISICILFGIAVKLFISITDASVNEDLRIEESNLGESSFEDIENRQQ